MKAISFVWTSPALVAGAKVVTRRTWTPGYAARFFKGEVCSAFTHRPERGGVLLGTIRLTAAPTWEPMSQMPGSDWAGEGHHFLYLNPEYIPLTVDGEPARRADFSQEAFSAWQSRDYSMWVVRFEFASLLESRETYLKETREKIAAQRAKRGVAW